MLLNDGMLRKNLLSFTLGAFVTGDGNPPDDNNNNK